MERVMCDGSGKNTFLHESINCAKSPTTFSTPVRQNDNKRRQNGFTSGLGSFNLLPAHITPPSGLTKFIARNPFDADLTSRLHLSVISPTVFTKVSPSMRQDSPSFSWSVDELALIQPAKIEEFPVQQMHSTDPNIEVVAQAAINEFFTANQIIPSPQDRIESNDEKSEMRTPSRPLEELNSTRETHKTKKDCWSQTVLTLPPVLPTHVEEALKPYFTFSQDQNMDNEDANSSNSSLRRKLFFNHDDCTEDEEEETSFSFSPTQSHESMIQSSPPQSGMLAHGTPLKGRSLALAQRTHGTPYAGNVSPPNMSPICGNNVSSKSIRSRCQLASHLDFTTDMSIDQSVRDDKELKSLEDVDLDTSTSMLRSNVGNDGPEVRDAVSRLAANEESPDANETAEMLSREATPLKHQETSRSVITTSIGRDIPYGVKIANEWCKAHTDESCHQQNDTLLGYSCTGQQSYVNSAQDTGYQTYSMSNITGNTENCSITNTKSFHWNEKILSNGDEIILSDWKDNMKNMFSSTPSKYTRRRDN